MFVKLQSEQARQALKGSQQEETKKETKRSKKGKEAGQDVKCDLPVKLIIQTLVFNKLNENLVPTLAEFLVDPLRQ